MPRRFICPQEHEWEASLDAGDVAGGLACPVCGATDFTCLGDEPGTEPAPSHPNLSWVLPRVPGYDVLAELGHGGMGVVYRAFDRRRKQAVALKTLQGFSPSALLRFKREFRTLAEVTHPNLVTLFEPVFDGTQWYFTMELVEGVDFLRHVRGGVIASAPTLRTSHLPDDAHPNEAGGGPRLGSAPGAEQLARLRAALRQLAEGVAALHEAGKLHRDIKPGNVLVTPQGRVVLLDFGLAADLGARGHHESSQPHLAGTVPYMSPEQVACRPLSPATDWYSVGVMLFEALTGRLPFEGDTHAVLRAKLERDAPPAGSLVVGLPGDLAVLTEHLLQRRPEDRPSAREVLHVFGGPPEVAPAAEAAFLDRRKELAALHEALEATRRGRTRTVLVHGPSGMGKSALVRHFLEIAAAQDDTVALLGRCYERESVPYKALDSLVDALSSYLRRLTEAEVQALLPRDVALLVRVFPVLGRVPAVAAAPRRDIQLRDVHELRRRAFAALRELLARLGDRRRLLLFIDDLQWGDTDSGLLLAELVRPPDAPALLLLASFRREDRAASTCLRALLQSWDQPDLAPDCSEVAVDPLSPAEAQELARALLGPAADPAQVEAVARESGGSPLFIQELAQYLRSEDGRVAPGGGVVTFDEMVWSRIERLPADERRLLEVVAVAGRPLAPPLARQAAELQGDERGLVAHLRSVRLLRGTASPEGGEIETYHDRVREAVTAHLPAQTLAAHHGRLAGVLEETGPPDPELLAVHLQEAGERRRAGTWYVRAADQAAETLAFDRAARLYRRGLDLRTLQGNEERALRVRLAEALAHAGRGPESAREYLAAAQGAGPDEVLDLRRRAALRLLTCGHYRDGLGTLRPLLDAAGLRLPGGPGRALITLLFLRVRLRLRGLGFTPRPPHEIPVEDVRYMDVCWSVGVGLFPLDLLAAWGFLTRALLRALSTGDSLRVARGLALEAAFLVSGGGRRQVRLAAQALQVADRVARESHDPAVSGLVLLARGMASFSTGCWAEACNWFDQSEAVFREHGVGAAFETNLARLYSLLALYYRGEVEAIGRRAALLYQEGRERDDFLMVMLAGLVKLYGPLAADDPEGVRRGLAEIVQHCPEKGVDLLRHNVRLWQLNLDLYCGDGAAALRRLGEPLAPMERVMVSRSRHLRIPWEYKRGCCFLAAAEVSHDRGRLLRSTRRCARRLRGEGLAWADGLAGLLQAGVAACGGDLTGAAATLRQTASLFDGAGMPLHAAVARRRLGECLSGAGGGELIAQAETALTGRGVRNPLRMTALVAPGFKQ